METPIKIYYESKKTALIYGVGFIVVLLVGFLYNTPSYSYGPMYDSYLIKFIVIFLFVYGIIAYLLPVGVLELYKDRFIFKKGKFSISSNWSDVKQIAFQYGRGGVSGDFFIDTNHGATKLIDTKILKLKGTNESVEFNAFIQELEQISGKVIGVGEISLKQYFKGNVHDHLKGVEKVNNFWK